MGWREQMPLGVTAVMLPELDFEAQVALCQSLGVTHYVYRPRHIPEAARDQPYSNWGNHKFDLTPERLLAEGAALRKRLASAGLTPFGTVPAISAEADDEALTLHFKGAAAAGAPRVRVNPPAYPSQVFDFDEYFQRTCEHYRRAVALARPHGVKIVIEMHVGNMAVDAGLSRMLAREFEPEELGLILDLPNFAIEGTLAPQLAVSVVREWVDHCHVGGCRRVQGSYDAHGFRQPGRVMCPVTESDLPVPAWLSAVRSLERPVPLIIEDYTPNMPGALRLERSVQALTGLLDAMFA